MFRRSRDSRSGSGREVRPRSRGVRIGLLLIALIAILFGGVLFANTFGLLPPEVITWYPVALVGLAALYVLAALVRRRPTAMILSAAALGLMISLLLHTRGIADFRATAIGILLISVGTAAILRALLGLGITPLAE